MKAERNKKLAHDVTDTRAIHAALALFVTSKKQTAGHTMAAPRAVFSKLSNIEFSQTGHIAYKNTLQKTHPFVSELYHSWEKSGINLDLTDDVLSWLSVALRPQKP